MTHVPAVKKLIMAHKKKTDKFSSISFSLSGAEKQNVSK